MVRSAYLIAILSLAPTSLRAQPTFKLGVGSHIYPVATIQLAGTKVSRTPVKDDPGFRLQYHFLKEGKSVATIDARAQETADVPDKGPGTYAVALEVFFPAYKGGNDQKGQFKAISNFLTYKFAPGKAELLPQTPALVIRCGKGAGKNQDEKLEKGYAYNLVQGAALDTWPAPISHAWSDPKMVRCEITVPPETAGLLRLQVLDGDNLKRKQQIIVQGRALPETEAFSAPGKSVVMPLSAAETKSGKVDVTVQNLLPSGSAVTSTIEFIPAFAR